MTDQSPVRLERDSIDPAVAVITLNRPDAANSIDLPLAERLFDLFSHVADDPSARAVVIRGEGRFFCGGGDVTAFAGRDDLPQYLEAITVPLHAAVSTMRRMSQPIVAAVGGPAAGAGLGLVCAADFVIASPAATFVAAYSGIGLTPDAGVSWFLPRLVGIRRFNALTLGGRALTAAEAESWGIATEVVADDDLDGHALEVARRLAGGPTTAFGHTKRLLVDGFERGLDAHLDEEARTLSIAAETQDADEGIRAFGDRRPPTFDGR